MLAMPCDQALLSFAGTPHEASPADAADGVRSLSFWRAKLISVRPTGFLWALFRHCQWIVEVGSKSKAGMKCVDGVPIAAQSQLPYYRDKSWMLRPCRRYARFEAMKWSCELRGEYNWGRNAGVAMSRSSTTSHDTVLERKNSCI